MLSHERRVEDDTDRRYVTGVLFGDDDVFMILRALEGHGGALGVDEKDRDRVGKHLNRIRNQGQPYFEADLRDLEAVLGDLVKLWMPQTEAEWWRAQGAPGGHDAVEGLAQGRAFAIQNTVGANRIVAQILERITGEG